MPEYVETLSGLITDLRIGIALCTRLPIGPRAPLNDGEVAHASWTFPIAGILVGVAGALAYWLAIRLNVAPIPAAALALAATMALTGAMHEDGLADSFDGLGGKTREQKLEIMRDSRIGTFGALALVITLLLRWSTLADIAEPRYVAIALISAHAATRAGMTAFMHLVPLARADGLSSSAGRPPGQSVAAALAIGIFTLLFGFGAKGAMISLLLLAFAGVIVARIAIRQIGGQTGDVLGAFEQVGEAIILLIAASLF
jgi:adenosylcobinamide-GDP ribazoletransferase